MHEWCSDMFLMRCAGRYGGVQGEPWKPIVLKDPEGSNGHVFDGNKLK